MKKRSSQKSFTTTYYKIMKQEDKKPKKKRSEDKNIDQGKIVDTPNEITGYGIRVRPRIDQSKVLGRRTIRL